MHAEQTKVKRRYISWVRTLIAAIVALLLAETVAAQEAISFPTEDGQARAPAVRSV